MHRLVPRPRDSVRKRFFARYPRTRRAILIGLGVVVFLGVILDVGLDAPLRSVVERRINQSLVGYTASLGDLNFHLIGLSLDMKNLVVRQQAHPDPAVLQLPRFKIGISWRDLFYAHLVADAQLDDPAIHANLQQLSEENRDQVPFKQRGWQQALEAIYPLKINELRIRNGTMVYQDDSGFRPLFLSGVDIVAGNIRNVRSPDRQYPSTIHAEGWVFDVGRAVIDGQANLLAEPTPGVKGAMELDRVELSYFEPLVEKLGLTVRRGFVDARGRVEVGPGVQIVEVDSLVITAAAVDYRQGLAPTPEAQQAGTRISEAAQYALAHPESAFRVKSLRMDNGTIGIINQSPAGDYRLFVANADLEVKNVSSRAEDGPAVAELRGAFMGSGTAAATATFYPGDSPQFDAKIEIEKTKLKSLNEMLRAKGNFDVSEGTFSLYSKVEVKDHYIHGYVKPLFDDVKVYDSQQDKNENVLHKMYEGIVEGVAKILENKHGEVATVASLDGPVENPKANTMQVIRGLLRNAFVKAILPGFQDQIARLEPAKYRAVRKKEEKEKRAPERRATSSNERR